MRSRSKDVTRVKLSKGRYLVKRGETWYLETCARGLQTRHTLGTEDLQEATKRAAEGWTPAQAPPPPPTPKRADALTLGKAAEEYRKWFTEYRRASSTRRSLSVVDLFVAAVGADRDLRTLQQADVQAWVKARKEGRSPFTVRNDFARVRALVYWIADNRKGPVDRGCCRGIELPKIRRSAKAAPPAEKIRAVLRALSGHWMADYFRVLLETGMRPSELLGIRGSDLREAEGLLTITPTAERDVKNDYSARTIKLNAVAAEILKARKERMLDKTRAIFCNELGEVYKQESAYHLFRSLLSGDRAKKVPAELDVTLYDARHFFCTEHAAPGPQHMAIEVLAAYIGHSPASTMTLRRYYVDQDALLRGAPAPVLGEAKEGKVVDMR